jgi:hypothetical protein
MVALADVPVSTNFVSYRNKAAFVVGIATITFLSWFRGTAITYFPDTLEGNDRFDYFKKVVSVEKIDLLFANFTSDLSDVTVALIVRAGETYCIRQGLFPYTHLLSVFHPIDVPLRRFP